MTRLSAIATFIFAVHTYAEIPCPSVEAIKKVVLTDAGEGSFFSGTIWSAYTENKCDSDHTWTLFVMTGADNKEDALREGNACIQIASSIFEEDSDEESSSSSCEEHALKLSKSREDNTKKTTCLYSCGKDMALFAITPPYKEGESDSDSNDGDE